MAETILLAANENVSCPTCGHGFPISQGITRQTIEHYKKAFSEKLKLEEDQIREESARMAELKVARGFQAQIDSLKGELAEGEKVLNENKAKQEALLRDAKAKAVEELQVEQKALKEELAQKDERLINFREQEIKLLQDKKALEEQRADMELQIHRKLDEARGQIEKNIRESESERYRLIEAEYIKKFEDAQRVNEDLQRKLQQGSSQLQGEVLEIELEETLRLAFPLDSIEPVAKGRRGADVLQRVVAPTGQLCGVIIWESKRAANWSDGWLTKLKDDQQEARAEVAVLVTTTMPRDIREPFAILSGIWVVRPEVMRPLGETLRVSLMELQKLKAGNEGRQDKMELLYDYLASPQFGQRIRTVVECFFLMKRELDSEKAAMQRIWKKRETQIERVTSNMMGICGELQAIAQNTLPGLDGIALLPADEDAALLACENAGGLDADPSTAAAGQ